MTIQYTWKVFGKEKSGILRPVKAIREHCLDCLGNSSDEVKRCSLKTCPLHPFRFGKNVGTKRTKKILSDEEKGRRAAIIRERFAGYRRSKKINPSNKNESKQFLR